MNDDENRPDPLLMFTSTELVPYRPLERCPFCLDAAAQLFVHQVDGRPDVPAMFQVECSSCNACGSSCDTHVAAVKAWNEAWGRVHHYATQMGRWVALASMN